MSRYEFRIVACDRDMACELGDDQETWTGLVEAAKTVCDQSVTTGVELCQGEEWHRAIATTTVSLDDMVKALEAHAGRSYPMLATVSPALHADATLPPFGERYPDLANTSLATGYPLLSDTERARTRKFSDLAEALKHPQEVVWLHLNFKNLQTLSPDIGRLRRLQVLRLKGNELKQLPPEIGYCENLEELQLQDNLLSNLPQSFAALRNLRILYLQGNRFSDFPPAITTLDKLERLNLRESSFSPIPAEIGSLQNLTYLNVAYNRALASLPSSMANLTRLEEIEFDKNERVDMASSAPIVASMPHLRRLNISHCPGVTEDMPLPKTLEELDMSFCQSLPQMVTELKDLQVLDLKGMGIGALPAEIGNLEKLATLDLSDNALMTLPETMGNLAALRELDLASNQLGSFPECITNCAHLTRFRAPLNALTTVPASFGKLTRLRTLDLSGNRLTGLPRELGLLTELEELDLRKNGLKSLPAELSQLTKLTRLDLGDNGLSSFPADFALPPELEFLNLSGNAFGTVAALAAALEGCTKLTTVRLADNAIADDEQAREQLAGLLPGCAIEFKW